MSAVQTERATVLWISAETPDRRLGGGNVRQSYLIERLAGRADIDLLLGGPEPDDEVQSAVRSMTVLSDAGRHRWHPPRGFGRLRLHADGILPGGPDEVRWLAAARRAFAEELRSRGRYDVVIVEHTGLAPLVSERRPGERWLLTLHNLPSVSGEQALAVSTTRSLRWLARGEIRQGRAVERRSVQDFDGIITVGPNDAERLPGPSTIVPNGVDLARYRVSPLPTEQHVVFTGTLDYPPNVDGAGWLCREIWPRVRAKIPTATLVIAGRQPAPEVLAFDGLNGVSVVANPVETAPLMAAARTAVVPLRQGSGTRLKALEAMACGRPVVGTSIGLAGLGIVDGQDAVVRDDAGEFATAVVALLADDPMADRLAQRGPQFVRSFSWDVVGATFVDYVLAEHPGPRE